MKLILGFGPVPPPPPPPPVGQVPALKINTAEVRKLKKNVL